MYSLTNCNDCKHYRITPQDRAKYALLRCTDEIHESDDDDPLCTYDQVNYINPPPYDGPLSDEHDNGITCDGFVPYDK